MRKTKKYYRDLINKDKNFAFSIAEEVITKYGTHTKTRGERTVLAESSFPYNCQIHGFSIYKKKFYVDIYWQGDSTDGIAAVLFKDAIVGTSIPREIDGSYEIHGNLQITPEMVHEALKDFAKRYLN